MILIYSINNLDIFKEFNFYAVGSLAYGVLYLVFIFLQIYIIKNELLIQPFKYLTENLNFNYGFSKYFWLVTESKKITYCLSFLLNDHIYLWTQFSVCLLSLFINLIFRPYNHKKLDLFYLLISDILQILIMLILILMNQNSQYSQSLQDLILYQELLINILLLLQIFFAIMHSFIQIEYTYRQYLQFSQRKLKESFIHKQNGTMMIKSCSAEEHKVRQEGISASQIESILNTKTFSISFSRKRSKQTSIY
ncbi:transmembrane protein, putative (macronuclear) [Tetrahymena thermophila SB210]|uniref:Transmembrane protein, putative n=1 Tax=Tetrahymena thermophila (strain SB210) TaxID=312017 RepID=W7XAV0_TETTS|nr:transmembrane protein, putative [Tetrahymena thermophila SB210]EWS76510.1 transmembrane protein, putative [Tetrahymena thermophila SB210]|eukprot:XP_012650955.1 transmembrane protein, putative [Tetrahymena thermophila SB210]